MSNPNPHRTNADIEASKFYEKAVNAEDKNPKRIKAMRERKANRSVNKYIQNLHLSL